MHASKASPFVFDAPTLGAAVCLGELYDERNGQFLGVQLYPSTPDDSLTVAVTDVKHTELSLSLSNTHEQKANLLDIKAKLSLDILSGLVKVSGSAAYLNDSKSNTNEYAYALALKMRLKEKRLLFAETAVFDTRMRLTENGLGDYIGKGRPATHFVSSIIYGGNFIVNLVARKSELSKEEKIEGKLKAEFDKLKGAISLEGEVEAKISGKVSKLDDKFDLFIHGDVALDKVPINPQDVLQIFPEAASLITNGGGVPISVTLQPIPYELLQDSVVYQLEADYVDKLLKAFTRLGDLHNRFTVLEDSVHNLQSFVPELARMVREVAGEYATKHGELLNQLGQFLRHFQETGEITEGSIFGGKSKNKCVFKQADELYNKHTSLTSDDDKGRYPSTLVGLEAEFSQVRDFVSDIRRVRRSVEDRSVKAPTLCLSDLDDVSRAFRLQDNVPLFIMTPFRTTLDSPQPDLVIIRFLAILRKYVQHFIDTPNPAHILYAESLKDLEDRIGDSEHELPNGKSFSQLDSPSFFIGQADAGGRLSWSGPPPTMEFALDLHSKPAEVSGDDGDLSLDLGPVNGKKSFTFQIRAELLNETMNPLTICILQDIDEDAFLTLSVPLTVELQRSPELRNARIWSNTAVEVEKPFTVTFVQNVKEKKWTLYLDDKPVGEVSFVGTHELSNAENVRLAYPSSESWWDGEVYGVKAFCIALTKEQITAMNAADRHKDSN